MAEKEFFLGSVGPLLYEDTDVYPSEATTLAGGRFPQIILDTAAIDATNALRLGELAAAIVHNMFSSTHGDTTGAAAPVDGDIVIANATPKWSKLAISIPSVGNINYLGIANGELRPSWKTFVASVRVAVKGIAYLLNVNDDLVVFDSAAAVAATLPKATGSGKEFMVKSIGVGVITVTADGTETIDGDVTQPLNQWEAIHIVDYAAGKWVIV
jgi:hypothetical protein